MDYLHRFLKALSHPDLQGLKLTKPQIEAVVSIYLNPGISINALAALRGVPKSTLSRQLKKLYCPVEKRGRGRLFGGVIDIELVTNADACGLLSVEFDPSEPLKRSLFVTKKGEQLMNDLDGVLRGGKNG